VWRSKKGNIALSNRDKMPNDYLQRVLNYSEHRYMDYNNKANSISVEIEKLEQQLKEAFDKSVVFKGLVKEIRSESTRRGFNIESLADKNPDKFEILRNDFKLDAAAAAQLNLFETAAGV
jgi:hypothetical protein